MRRFFLISLTLVAGIAYVGVFHVTDETPASPERHDFQVLPRQIGTVEGDHGRNRNQLLRTTDHGSNP